MCDPQGAAALRATAARRRAAAPIAADAMSAIAADAVAAVTAVANTAAAKATVMLRRPARRCPAGAPPIDSLLPGPRTAATALGARRHRRRRCPRRYGLRSEASGLASATLDKSGATVQGQQVSFRDSTRRDASCQGCYAMRWLSDAPSGLVGLMLLLGALASMQRSVGDQACFTGS